MEMFKEFKKAAIVPGFTPWKSVLLIAQEYLSDDKVKAFYPKGDMESDDNGQLYIFTESDLWIFQKENSIEKIQVKKDIKVTEITRSVVNSTRPTGLNLQIQLESGEIIDFNASEGVNEQWLENFNNYIELVFTKLR
ncbi:hypothetical protein [Paenibacillus sp. FSL H8-0260]|uniref:hypothetical protein n=1 Tax=Paenibacillus sp. FSL H8-0260 TaxID=2921380 RepID=UPI00324B0827